MVLVDSSSRAGKNKPALFLAGCRKNRLHHGFVVICLS